jgi:hypothetical protein
MVAYFVDNKLRKVDVLGNAESLYYALENDTATTGMNKAVSANMVLRFADNKLQTITFLTNPDAKFIPPHELKEEDKQLKGFLWQIERKPTRRMVLGKHFALPTKAKKTKKAAPAKGKSTKAKPGKALPAKGKPAVPKTTKPTVPNPKVKPVPKPPVPAVRPPAAAATPQAKSRL